MKIIIAILMTLSPQLSLATDCPMALQQHLTTDLDMSYKDFDQTNNSGMRVLGNAGCHKETADLIEAYIEKNKAKQNSLRWHIAQQRAMAGENELAIISAKKSLLEKENFSIQPLRWNEYVLATIAFLEGNKQALLIHRNKVAEGKDVYFGNRINLRILDGLIKNFGKSYSFATSNL